MNRCRESGFTLLEMIIVLVILGLMLALVVTRGPMHSARLDTEAAARELAGALRLARGRAIAQDRSVSIVLTPHTYQVDGLPQHTVPADVALAGNASIRFAPDGSSSGGTLLVQTPTSRTTIVVSWLTGSVEVAPTQ
jgi:general secretion pathway protein H